MREATRLPLAGLAAGLLLVFCAFVLVGIGKGTLLPMSLFFGPLLPSAHLLGGVLVVTAGPFLYAAYGFCLYRGRLRGHTRLALAAILFAHYLLAVVDALILRQSHDIGEGVFRAMSNAPLWFILTAMLFVGVNCMALYYVLQSESHQASDSA